MTVFELIAKLHRLPGAQGAPVAVHYDSAPRGEIAHVWQTADGRVILYLDGGGSIDPEDMPAGFPDWKPSQP